LGGYTIASERMILLGIIVFIITILYKLFIARNIDISDKEKDKYTAFYIVEVFILIIFGIIAWILPYSIN